MTNRQRLLAVLRGEIPDCVPVCPDMSNMIPCRLTGKPFWDMYLYNDPPMWKAYIDCARHFNIDAFCDCHVPVIFPEEIEDQPEWENFIVQKNERWIITQKSYKENGTRVWASTVDVYYVADPPSIGIMPEKVGLPKIPTQYEPLEGVKSDDTGPEGLKRAKTYMGEQGLIATPVTCSLALCNPDAIYEYYDNPDKHEQWAQERIEKAEKRFYRVMSLETKPDVICVGGSGTLIFQTVEMFRKIAFPAVKRVIELATQAGLPTHVHSCGPEAELVKIFAEETELTLIDPLEIPPMGDCNLAKIKRKYGNKIILKGNLHTTDVMLRGSYKDVVDASRKAIDDAAEGGRFILSTGDQCGRDTPEENIRAMVETARTYGKYEC